MKALLILVASVAFASDETYEVRKLTAAQIADRASIAAAAESARASLRAVEESIAGEIGGRQVRPTDLTAAQLRRLQGARSSYRAAEEKTELALRQLIEDLGGPSARLKTPPPCESSAREVNCASPVEVDYAEVEFLANDWVMIVRGKEKRCGQ